MPALLEQKVADIQKIQNYRGAGRRVAVLGFPELLNIAERRTLF